MANRAIVSGGILFISIYYSTFPIFVLNDVPAATLNERDILNFGGDMFLLVVMLIGVVAGGILPISELYGTQYDKRTEFDDPRMFSSAFGKRSSMMPQERLERSIIIEDPRMMTNAFGKRDAFVDPRFFSSSFGKRSSGFDDPRFFSSSFGKRSDFQFDDPRFASLAFGRRR